MRRVLLASCCLLVFASVTMAQDKIDSKWHCKQAAEQKFDIGDQPDHSYAIAQGSCDATSSDSGFAEKTGAWTETAEHWKSSSTVHGRMIVTMENGENVYYSYDGTRSPEKKTATDRVKIVSGTGKYKGVKGAATCSGTLGDDNTSDWTCTGTYSTGTDK
ncbi:MAG: hypothetical protein WCA38_20170 [Candidatus Acidiferrales bacterium]